MKETIHELIEVKSRTSLCIRLHDRALFLFIELSEIITGKEIKAAKKCTKKEGNPPKQTVVGNDYHQQFYGPG